MRWKLSELGMGAVANLCDLLLGKSELHIWMPQHCMGAQFNDDISSKV